MNGFRGFALGWEASSLPKHPVFSFMGDSVQPQNELGSYRSMCILLVYLEIEVRACVCVHTHIHTHTYMYLERVRTFTMASDLVEDLGNLPLAIGRGLPVWVLRLGKPLSSEP